MCSCLVIPAKDWNHKVSCPSRRSDWQDALPLQAWGIWGAFGGHTGVSLGWSLLWWVGDCPASALVGEVLSAWVWF